VVICLERGVDCLRMVQLMPLHPKTPSSVASVKSRLVLPFWYQLTQVVLEKRPLNRCISSSTCPIFTKFFMHVTYRRGSVLLWWHSDMLSTSVFMDNVISQGCSTSSPS